MVWPKTFCAHGFMNCSPRWALIYLVPSGRACFCFSFRITPQLHPFYTPSFFCILLIGSEYTYCFASLKSESFSSFSKTKKSVFGYWKSRRYWNPCSEVLSIPTLYHLTFFSPFFSYSLCEHTSCTFILLCKLLLIIRRPLRAHTANYGVVLCVTVLA